MKLISWNVNGIRSVLGKGFLKFVTQENPDILCLQETRSPENAVELNLSAYHRYWNVCPENAGYSGTLIFTKKKPMDVARGMGIQKHDQEGRIVTAEYEKFFLVNVYTPNSKRDLSRLDYRQEWDRDFLKFIKKREEKKPVIFCGDLNVAHKERDLTHPQANRRNHGFTDEERAGFDQIVKSGFVDTFRELVEEGGHYTWWSPFADCRARNIGWRIDYVCISSALRPHLQDAFIFPKVLGSDHCPVGIEIEL
ncbi:MAG: exodeoxyribonuclease III [Candidatus Omnitrophica bacterium]|nr:exodeoxyribonuclease III [Candidatus Omnitrophota bacterium]